MALMKSNPRRLAVIIPPDEPVQNGLAFTPAQMLELQQQGIPISSMNVGLSFDEGSHFCSWDVPLEHTRGIDPADLWEASQNARDKINKGFNKIYDMKSLEKSLQKAPDNV